MEPSNIKFETYRYYLHCISNFLVHEYQTWDKFGLKCIDATGSLQGMTEPDMNWIERFMKIAWNTEYVLSVGKDDFKFLRISNQWAPIQAYYVLYSGAEALAYVIDGMKADGHAKALKKATDFFMNKKLAPWDKAFKGPRGKRRNEHQPVNFPVGISIPSNLKRMGITPIEMIGTCLRAEHYHRIDDYKNPKGKSNLFQYEYDPGYTSLLHFFYRLRIKANYKEVDIFLTKAPDQHIKQFHKSLRDFCFWSLLYMEIVMARKCKKKKLLSLMDKYLSTNNKAAALKDRWEFLCKNL